MDQSLRLSVYDEQHILPPTSPEGMEHALNLLRLVQAGEAKYAGTLGWHSTALWADDPWLSRYEALAADIRSKADAFVVIGIGGSNQAARAVITALNPKNGPAILWAGNSISSNAIESVLDDLKQYHNIYINVIAKNFETLEPGIGFRALRNELRERYADWQSHVVATGTPGSYLEELSKTHGFTFLPFPEEIGGRFTALSPIGLFPMAVAGVDIRALAKGAADMEHVLKTDTTPDNPALRYAILRNNMYCAGYRMEMLAFFEPRMFRFSKWWVQLFGESEGKCQLGLYPLAANYSEDLHSIGQFVQEGTPVIFESFLTFRESDSHVPVPADQVADRFDYLNGMDFDSINRAACAATIGAHSQVLPCVEISLGALNAYSFGQLFYFFQFACYLSGRILGVNPFDQPGVEAYKTRMFQILGK